MSPIRPAPLSPEHRESPLWWDGVSFPPPATDPLPSEVDVVVVGAGFTGLAAALALQRRGRRTLVLDRLAVGAGASGRNAGMIHAGLRRDPITLQRRFGAAGSALHAASVDARVFVARLAAEVAPDADHAHSGWLYLAHRQARATALAADAPRRSSQLGEQTRYLATAEIAEETAAQGMHGALLTDNGDTIHPGRYIAGMLRAALGHGAEVMDRCAVRRIEPRPAGGFTVTTTRGAVRARDVLAAGNGYTDRATPALRRRIIPIGSYIIVTEPLTADLAASVSPHRRVMSDTRRFLHYWRLTSDNRLLFGGRTSFAPVTLEQARNRLYADMLDMYPQLHGARLSHSWSGQVGFTFDQLPHLGRLQGITYAMGYCGSGVAMASWLGTLAGSWIAGDAAPAFADLRFPTTPGYTGNPWFLPAAGWYHQLRDRWF